MPFLIFTEDEIRRLKYKLTQLNAMYYENPTEILWHRIQAHKNHLQEILELPQDMEPGSSLELSQRRNRIVRLRTQYKQAANKEERATWATKLDQELQRYHQLTKPAISHNIKVGV